METNSFVHLILMKLESELQLQDGESLVCTYLHRCLKIEAADDIGTCDNCNFQNEYLERFMSNLYK